MRDWFREHGLVRPRRGRMIGGVCRGIANKLGMRTWVVRLIAVASIVLPGPQVLAYLILWILMPSER
jgi:phage shock protein PspC (stress-responsive transcriptional regulator)